MDKRARIIELTELLNKAGKAYYQESKEIMTNLEYDGLYDELVELEKETGIILSESPTVNVGFEVISSLPKVKHDEPMLSLDKTKSVEELSAFLKDKKGVLSWKLDGLTVVLKYMDGKLIQAVTRGNGEIGEDITNNAKTFKNIPLSIPFKEELIVRGEAIIKYSDFEKINEEIEDLDSKYKNPRNLCSGSVRQLNNKITSERNVKFYSFNLVKAGEKEFELTSQQLAFLEEIGFSVVEYMICDNITIYDHVAEFAEKINGFDIPSDGLVLIYDDIKYGRSLGRTSKFPRNGIAFKWADEVAKTTLKEIEWSPSRTGLINPVAIFEPVELEGTTVSRASVHNISIVESLRLGIGDEIEVYKANMIIPQIKSNITMSGKIEIPSECPACGGKTVIKQINDVKSLYCPNEKCVAKHVKKFTHFAGREGMNIEGMSEETMEKFIDKGFIHKFGDIYKLEKYKQEIIDMAGFGEKSYEKIIESVNRSRKAVLPRLIYSFGIMNVGLSNAKVICRYYDGKIERLLEAKEEELVEIEGIGEVIAKSFYEYINNPENKEEITGLLKELEIEAPEEIDGNSQISGKTFVITGSVLHFSNRNEIKEIIESKGGKVTGSVTSKTDYLINNDTLSSSSKNKKAKELDIPIISEEDFLKMIQDI